MSSLGKNVITSIKVYIYTTFSGLRLGLGLGLGLGLELWLGLGLMTVLELGF